MPVTAARARPAGDDEPRVLPPCEGGPHLADTLLHGQQARAPELAEGLGEVGVLDGQGGDPGRLELLDGPASR